MIRCDGPEWLFDRLDFREIADRLQCAGPAALKKMEPLQPLHAKSGLAQNGRDHSTEPHHSSATTSALIFSAQQTFLIITGS
jgi:hypothetical protein